MVEKKDSAEKEMENKLEQQEQLAQDQQDQEQVQQQEQQNGQLQEEQQEQVVEPIEEESTKEEKRRSLEGLEQWKPKTELGRKVKNGEITDIDYILDRGYKILEPEIVDMLLDIETDLIFIGQAKGKFGGGKRRAFRSTQKKTEEGNRIHFEAMAVVGDKNGHVGIGYGKSTDTLPAKEKAIRNAKLNIFRIRRGCGSWECSCKEHHSIPMKVSGKESSVEITLMPAPKGKGIVADEEIAKVLRLVGIRDIWTKSRGQTRSKINHIKALEKALKSLSAIKINKKHIEMLNIAEGARKLYS